MIWSHTYKEAEKIQKFDIKTHTCCYQTNMAFLSCAHFNLLLKTSLEELLSSEEDRFFLAAEADFSVRIYSTTCRISQHNSRLLLYLVRRDGQIVEIFHPTVKSDPCQRDHFLKVSISLLIVRWLPRCGSFYSRCIYLSESPWYFHPTKNISWLQVLIFYLYQWS